MQSALAMAALPAVASDRLPIAMAVEYNMLPENIPIPDRFQMAKDAGFERIECPTTPNQADAEAMKAASEKFGLPIHSVMNSDHWKYPFSSPDPAIVEKSLEGARTSIRNAHFWGARTVLLVPAVVNAQTTYREAYERSQPAIRKLLPLAEELNVTLAIEEVWNKFLLSPLEFARYIDEFKSPRIRAYFDVGNVVLYGYPQDWIGTLGKRIIKLHIKDFSFREDSGEGQAGRRLETARRRRYRLESGLRGAERHRLQRNRDDGARARGRGGIERDKASIQLDPHGADDAYRVIFGCQRFERSRIQISLNSMLPRPPACNWSAM